MFLHSLRNTVDGFENFKHRKDVAGAAAINVHTYFLDGNVQFHEQFALS